MRFKSTNLIAACFVLSCVASPVLLSACRFHNKAPIATASSQLDAQAGVGDNCLTGASSTFSNYLEGKDKDGKIAGVWDCGKKSLTLFTGRIKGSVPGSYSMLELRNFIQSYFLKDFTITDSLLAEIGLVKQTLLGGNSTTLTVQEIQQIQKLLDIAKDYSVRLSPYMPMNLENMAKMEQGQLEAGLQILEAAARDVGSLFKSAGYPYSFTHMDRLIVEFQNAPQSNSPTELVREFRERIPLLRAAKAALIDHEPDRISPDDWSVFLTTGARWFGIIGRFGQFQNTYQNWTLGPGRLRLMELAKQIIQLADDTITHHPEKAISYPEIDALIDALKPEDLPASSKNTHFTASTLKKTLRPLLNNVLGTPDRKPVIGISHGTLFRLWAPIQRWSEGQHYLEALFAYKNAEAKKTGGVFEAYNPEQLLKPTISDVYDPSVTLNKEITDAAEDMRMIIADPDERPFFRGNETEITYAGSYDQQHSLFDLSQKNWMRQLSRVLVNGYRSNPELPLKDSDGATYQQFSQFYSDIKAFGVEIKFFLEQDDAVAMGQRFTEANMFTFAGNGDALLDVRELSQFFAFLMSAKVNTDRMHLAIVHQCNTTAPDEHGLDEWGYPMIDGNCFLESFFENYRDYWAHMPLLADYYGALNPAARKAFRDNYLVATMGYPHPLVASSDTQSFPMLAQYIEAMFAKFDTNQDGKIDLSEARVAFPIFRGKLADALKSLSAPKDDCKPKSPATDKAAPNWELWGAFTYLLAYGKPPSTIEFLGWEARKLNWGHHVQADRGKVLDILAEINRLDQQNKEKHGHTTCPQTDSQSGQ